MDVDNFSDKKNDDHSHNQNYVHDVDAEYDRQKETVEN
jgi:hypothetical protein